MGTGGYIGVRVGGLGGSRGADQGSTMEIVPGDRATKRVTLDHHRLSSFPRPDGRQGQGVVRDVLITLQNTVRLFCEQTSARLRTHSLGETPSMGRPNGSTPWDTAMGIRTRDSRQRTQGSAQTCPSNGPIERDGERTAQARTGHANPV
jgi:hypothetical protein